jgi:CRISPR-associated protein Csh1
MNFRIKNKLNIWFSLYEYFDHQPQTNGEIIMAERIKSLQAKMDRVATQPDDHLEDDGEFAFAAGQIIYYLLNCSETSNKTHALLEPFLQKVDAGQLKLAISRTFNQYKHAIKFYKGKFEKLMSEILSYEPEDNLKAQMPMILAGYFSDNVIFRKIEKQNLILKGDSNE